MVQQNTKAREHGPKMVATHKAIKTDQAKTNWAKTKVMARVSAEQVPEARSPEKGPQCVPRKAW